MIIHRGTLNSVTALLAIPYWVCYHRLIVDIIFAGSSDFAVPSLEGLLAAGYPIKAVYTQPDRPAGRGRQLTATPIKRMAEAHGLTVHQPETLKDLEVQAQLRAWQPDVLVVVAYSLLVPQAVLDIPRYGCINLHPSLLPRWRGAAPVQRAIEAGDTETGVTIMQMELAMDAGPILAQQRVAIESDDTSLSLLARCATVGGKLLVDTVSQLQTCLDQMQLQDHAQSTHAAKISKSEALIDWQEPALVIARRIRAFNPFPICYTHWQGQRLKIYQASVVKKSVGNLPNQTGEPGSIYRISDQALWVNTGEGFLSIESVQLPGGRVLSVTDFLHAHHKAELDQFT